MSIKSIDFLELWRDHVGGAIYERRAEARQEAKEETMSVLRFDPFRELERWNDQAWSRPRRPAIPFDAYRRAHELVMEFDLPGVDPASIDLTVEKGSLTVSAERRTGRRDGDDVLVHERAGGHATRQLLLGEGLDTTAVRADYDAGVLTVVVPVAEDVKPRRVEVHAASPSPSSSAIDAEAGPSESRTATAAA